MKSYLYSEIKLNSNFDNYINIEADKLDAIKGLSLVNIFVGSNNSGKSRCLREIFKIKDYVFNTKDPDTFRFLENVRFLSQELSAIKNSEYAKGFIEFSIEGVGKFTDSDFNLINFDFFDFSADFASFKRLLESFPKFNNFATRSTTGHPNVDLFRIKIKGFEEQYKEDIEFVKNFDIKKLDHYKFYIPISRSLNNFNKESWGRDQVQRHDLYKERVDITYQLKGVDNAETFTGQELYFDVRKMLLGEKEERKRIAEYEKFLTEKIFGGKETLLIPKEGADVLHIKIGDDEKPIYELGDGIQNLIILTFPIFMRESALFFIEEPETHLHPGMQRKFLELLLELKDEKNHQYFITTHSNHFLDLTLDHNDISIYKFFSKEDSDKKIVEQVSSGDETVLFELGVKNSSVFLTNATIWVEGITDRLYIKKFLELYQDNTDVKKRIFEDTDYSFVEYGGNNITHWSFLESEDPTIYVERLCGKAYLITDKDTGKEERQKKLKEKLGTDRYKCLDCREIENILSLKTIEKVIKSYPRDSAFTLPPSITGYPHKKIPFGTFINQSLNPENKYAAISGSLLATKKLEFCRRAIDGMTYSEMTPLAKNLAKGIYDFVVLQN